MKTKAPDFLAVRRAAPLLLAVAGSVLFWPSKMAAFGPVAAPGLAPAMFVAPALSTKPPTHEAAPEPQCFLFTNGSQELSGLSRKPDAYRPYFADCHPLPGPAQDQELIALRSFTIKNETYYLLVQPESLETQILKASCLACQERHDETSPETHPPTRSRYQSSLERYTAPPANGKRALENEGLSQADSSVTGSFLTGDLCPSHKPLDRAFFEKLQHLDPEAHLGLAVSGYWIVSHRDEFNWLKERISRGLLKVTWVNHSYSHPYKEGIAYASNFLLTPGVNLEREVLETERVMIAGGVTPSIFFRAPGLVLNDEVIQYLKHLHLIPLGAEAWLAKGQKPKPGSVILVHVNGNEPLGLSIFDKLVNTQALPLPLLPLSAAPDK
jgi:hypothetical protein